MVYQEVASPDVVPIQQCADLSVCQSQESPRRNLPTAARRYFYRLIIFYIGCVLAIGVLAPYNDSRLTDGGAGAGSSAFVVGITNAGIPVLSSIINAGVHRH